MVQLLWDGGGDWLPDSIKCTRRVCRVLPSILTRSSFCGSIWPEQVLEHFEPRSLQSIWLGCRLGWHSRLSPRLRDNTIFHLWPHAHSHSEDKLSVQGQQLVVHIRASLLRRGKASMVRKLAVVPPHFLLESHIDLLSPLQVLLPSQGAAETSSSSRREWAKGVKGHRCPQLDEHSDISQAATGDRSDKAREKAPQASALNHSHWVRGRMELFRLAAGIQCGRG